MLQQILTHTPLWVWAIFALLLYRGIIASVDREVPLRRVFLIPLLMLGLSLQGIVTSFGAAPAALPVWLACLLAGSVFAWQSFDSRSMDADPARGIVTLRGSWGPLALMMGIFALKYAVGVALALRPELRGLAAFAGAVCALYGLFSGIFVGNALRVLALYRQAGTAAVAVR